MMRDWWADWCEHAPVTGIYGHHPAPIDPASTLP